MDVIGEGSESTSDVERVKDIVESSPIIGSKSEMRSADVTDGDSARAQADNQNQDLQTVLRSKKNWDDIAKRLVEAREALEKATEMDKKATQDLVNAQRKKEFTAKEVRNKARLVTELAAEFTTLTADLYTPISHAIPGEKGVNNNDKSESSTQKEKISQGGNNQELKLLSPAPPRPALVTAIRTRPPSSSVPTTTTTTTTATPNTTTTTNALNRDFRQDGGASNGLFDRSGISENKTASKRQDPIVIDDSDNGTAKKMRTEFEVSFIAEEEALAARSASGKKKSHSYGKSLFRGVRKVLADGSYEARISINGQDLLLGRFPDEEEAARNYDAAARKHRKGAAVLNFITDEDRLLGCKSAFE